MITGNLAGQCMIDDKTSNKYFNKVYYALLKERLDNYGVDSLLDEEIISLLTGINVDLIKKALDNFGALDLFKYINSMNLTKIQRRKLFLINMFYKRMLLAEHKEKEVVNTSSKASEFCKKLFVELSYEAFFLICLDSQNRLNHAIKVHEGTINESPVYPRVIVENALSYRANSVILAHNHPGGSLTPSAADKDVTKKIQQALSPISIQVVDHIIVADGKTFSFAEQGLL